ncbi:MAG: T9SS type A sorting domain-containing protein [Bacteroidetes bacterium]|nr:T9SS type A sorting domain-containing protein [Bacteroidota bacterium]
MKRKLLLLALATVILILSLLYIGKNKSSSQSTISVSGKSDVKQEGKFGPEDWMARQRAYPYGKINVSAYLDGMEQATKLRHASPKGRYNWELAGPTNVGGRITDIAFHPNAPFTWYIGAASGGILKTTDGGETWDNVFEDADVISIGDIAIDPSDQSIIYAGTGEANASSYSFFGNGVYKSTDAGQTWQHSGLENSAYIGRIIVDYDNPQRVYVAACGNLFTPDENRGIYRSLDGGASWEKILFLTDSTSGVDLVQDPHNPDIIYATMWERMRGLNYRRSFGESSGIYKTTDGGDTWDQLINGLPVGDNVGRIGIDIAASSPNTLYSFIDMDYYEVRVYRSDDAGASWVRKNDGLLQQMNSNFGWYFGQIRVDPANAERVFVLGVYAYRSETGGNSWMEIGDWDFHVDHHALSIDNLSGMCVEGNDGGLYTSFNYGTTWAKVYNLPITQFYDIEVDFVNSFRIYGGTQDNGTIRTLTGSLDDWQNILGGDGFYCVVDYANPSIIYAEYQWGGLNKSTNGGGYFESIGYEMYGDRTNWSSPLVIHPLEPSVLYFGTYRVWKSIDWGTSWTAVSSDMTDGDDGSTWHTVSTLAVSPLDPSIVLAGTDDGHVHISVNGGSTWNEISEGLPKRWITGVAADPHDANTIYATISGFRWDEPLPHVFKSTDLGETWTSISSNLPELPMNCILLDPEIPNRILVGSDAGVYYTENGGQNWISVSQGLGNVAVTAMKLHSPTRTLIMGTYGLSAYKINIDDISVGISNPSDNQTFMPTLEVYPNPAGISEGKEISFSFELSRSGHIELSIADINGHLIRILKTGYTLEGPYTQRWNGTTSQGEKLKAGLYIVQLKSNVQTTSRKFIVQ